MNVALHESFLDEQPVRDRHWKIRPGDVVLDIGASEGSYTLPALRDGAAKVYAFNPGKADADKLTSNLDVNPGYADRCEIVRLAIGGVPGWFKWEESSLRNEPPEDGEELIEAVTLDGFLSMRTEIYRVDWIKIDIEGAEVAALGGAEATLRRFKPNILVENHLFMDPTIQQRVQDVVFGLDLGYSVESHPWHSISHSFFRRP